VDLNSRTTREAALAIDQTSRPSLRDKAMHELIEFVIIAAYLYICFFSITVLKVAILHTHGIAYMPVGTAFIKALLLAKFMMLGHGLHIGERFSSHPLIWPTISKAFAFLLLLTVLTFLEEGVVGAISGLSVSQSLADLIGVNFVETLAKIFIVFLILVPYFAFVCLREMLGKGELRRMFFVDRGTLTYRPTAQVGSPPPTL
jgi:hypothetical protein